MVNFMVCVCVCVRYNNLKKRKRKRRTLVRGVKPPLAWAREVEQTPATFLAGVLVTASLAHTCHTLPEPLRAEQHTSDSSLIL